MMLRRMVAVICIFLLASLPVVAGTTGATGTNSDQPYDLVIRNGHIIDGTGSPWYSGDVAIRDGRIVAIGRLGKVKAKRTIDASGKVVAPGFIDMMDHSGLSILVAPSLPSKLYQGITTVIAGEGDTVAPLNDQIIKNREPGYKALHIHPTWRTLGGYFDYLQKKGIGINFASYIGATQVRLMVLGTEDVQPTAAQLKQMQQLVAQGMKDGAMGVSSALQYAPAPYAKTPELIALAKVASRYGGIYATHMRSEGSQEMSALAEAIEIGRKAHIPVEVFHLKVSGKKNWGRMPEVVKAIERARHEGIDVSADTYAYTAWRNGLSAFLPPWALAGGRDKLVARLKDPATRARIKNEIKDPSKSWANDEWQEIGGDPHAVLITSVSNPKLRWMEGKRLSEVAEKLHMDPIDAVFDILVKDDGGGNAAYFGMQQSDVNLALKQPWVSICTDETGFAPTGILGERHPHPRAYGAFPRIIRKYVRQDHLLTLPDAIRKMTSLPAQRMGLTQRGVIKKGMYADLVVFDPAQVQDESTFANPNRLAKGMDDVIVNGTLVIDHGKMKHALPGKVLRGPGYVPGG